MDTQNQKELASFSIPSANLGELEVKMAQLDKKARKLGLPGVSYTVSDKPTGRRKIGENAFLEPIYMSLYTVTVSGPEPKINGWAFIASLDHSLPKTIIRKVLGENGEEPEVPEVYFSDEKRSRCDHCGHDRYRKDTFLLVNESGEIKQVGRTCLKDFLGHGSPEALAQCLTWLRDIEAFGEFDPDRMPRDKFAAEMGEFVALSAAFIREQGFISRGLARDKADKGEYIDATADLVWDVMVKQAYDPSKLTSDKSEAYRSSDKLYAPAVTDEDIAKAKAAIDWAAGMENPDHDYLRNLHAVALAPALREAKHVGLAASMLTAYDRHLKDVEYKNTRAEREAKSSWFGTVGQRVKISAKVDTIINIRGCRLAKLLVGNDILAFFSLRSDSQPIVAMEAAKKEGREIKISAVIKEHKEYRGAKETEIVKVNLPKAEKDRLEAMYARERAEALEKEVQAELEDNGQEAADAYRAYLEAKNRASGMNSRNAGYDAAWEEAERLRKVWVGVQQAIRKAKRDAAAKAREEAEAELARLKADQEAAYQAFNKAGEAKEADPSEANQEAAKNAANAWAAYFEKVEQAEQVVEETKRACWSF